MSLRRAVQKPLCKKKHVEPSSFTLLHISSAVTQRSARIPRGVMSSTSLSAADLFKHSLHHTQAAWSDAWLCLSSSICSYNVSAYTPWFCHHVLWRVPSLAPWPHLNLYTSHLNTTCYWFATANIFSDKCNATSITFFCHHNKEMFSWTLNKQQRQNFFFFFFFVILSFLIAQQHSCLITEATIQIAGK